jgi:hypothetical protein
VILALLARICHSTNFRATVRGIMVTWLRMPPLYRMLVARWCSHATIVCVWWRANPCHRIVHSIACVYTPPSCASSVLVSRRYHFDFQARRTNMIFYTGIFSFKFSYKSYRANCVFSFKFAYILLHMFAVWELLLAQAVAIVLIMAFFGRNSAARAKVSGDQRLASWILMACAAASRGAIVAEVDEDPWMGWLARRLLPSRHRRSPLHHRQCFGLLSTLSPVRLPGGVAGVARRLLFKLPGGSPFGCH